MHPSLIDVTLLAETDVTKEAETDAIDHQSPLVRLLVIRPDHEPDETERHRTTMTEIALTAITVVVTSVAVVITDGPDRDGGVIPLRTMVPLTAVMTVTDPVVTARQKVTG